MVTTTSASQQLLDQRTLEGNSTLNSQPVASIRQLRKLRTNDAGRYAQHLFLLWSVQDFSSAGRFEMSTVAVHKGKKFLLGIVTDWSTGG